MAKLIILSIIFVLFGKEEKFNNLYDLLIIKYKFSHCQKELHYNEIKNH
jgi:hypothetical protein